MGKFVLSLLFAVSLFAQQPSTRVYTVTNAAAFPSLTAAAGSTLMIFINGMFAAPGSYTLTPTATAVSVRFAPGVLLNGDKIAIVTLPVGVVGPAGPGAFLTSATSNVLAAGNLQFTTQPGQAFTASEYVALISGSGAYAYGTIVSYVAGALLVDVTEIYAGSGSTFSSWVIVPTGIQGPVGAQGAAAPVVPNQRTCSYSLLGDGAALSAGSYPGILPLTSVANAYMGCPNNTAIAWTVTAIHCYSDNIGSSTLDVVNNAGVSFLLMPVVCAATYAGGGTAGTLAQGQPNLAATNTTLAPGDAFRFRFNSDGITQEFRATVDYQ